MDTNKTLLTIAMMLVTLYWTTARGQSESYAPTVEKLRTFYAETNKTYFNNELPQNVRISIFDSKTVMGHTDTDADGTVHIFIDRQSHPIEKEAEMTEAHEMCHLRSESPFDESEEFQACMVDLAKRGAFKGIW